MDKREGKGIGIYWSRRPDVDNGRHTGTVPELERLEGSREKTIPKKILVFLIVRKP